MTARDRKIARLTRKVKLARFVVRVETKVLKRCEAQLARMGVTVRGSYRSL